ncbi:MAG: hypothetical protein P8125_07795 [Gemmatimonadota bacterium]
MDRSALSKLLWMMIAVAVPLAACGDDDPAGPSGQGATVSLSVAVPAPAPLAAYRPDGALFAMVPVTDGVSTLEIETVEIVLREIELERTDSEDCNDNAGVEDDDCEEFETGPYLLDVPLDATGAAQAFAIPGVPAGSYDEIEFEIHTPQDDPGDDAFLIAHPEFEGISVRATGTFDDGQGGEPQPFVFESNLSQEQEMELAPPLVVGDGSAANVTLQVDVSTWFFAADGVTLLDPSTASTGEPNESVVEENIQNSLHVYEDDDRDGEDDSEELDDLLS